MPGQDESTKHKQRRDQAGDGEPESGHATGEEQAAENRENDPPA